MPTSNRPTKEEAHIAFIQMHRDHAARMLAEAHVELEVMRVMGRKNSLEHAAQQHRVHKWTSLLSQHIETLRALGMES